MAGPTIRRIHLYIFRILFVTSFFQLWSIILVIFYWTQLNVYDWLNVTVCCEVFLHHVFSVWHPTTLPNILDLILVMTELSVWAFLLGKFPKRFKFDPWAPQGYTIYILSQHVQIAALFILLGFRIHRLTGAERKGLFIRFTFEPVTSQQTPMPWYSVLFGTSLFKPRYRNEAPYIRGLRALLSYILIIGLIVYSLFVLVLGPVRETALPPVKMFRGASLQDTQFNQLDIFVWRIFTLLDARTTQVSNITAANFKSSINVTALWDDKGPAQPCELESKEVRNYTNEDYTHIRSNTVDFITFICPSRYNASSPDDDTPYQEGDYGRYFDEAPDLFVTVNFTSLNISFNPLANARQRAVSILVGLTSNNADALSNTVPTPLFPGSHLHGSILRQARKISVPHALASLGTFASSRTFLTARITSLTSDPSPLTTSQLGNTATLRLYTQNDPSDWVIGEDYRDHDVLDGFSSVGGFWAFVNGLFAVFFGSTLATIIFGWKHLSILGLLDGVGKENLRDHFHKEYPMLKEEASSAPDQRGHLALLRDHLVDLDILDHAEPADSRHNVGIGSSHPEMIEQGGILPA